MLIKSLRNRRILSNVLIFVVVVIASAAAIGLLSADARKEIDALAVANADSTQWSLAQAEVEFLAFANTARSVVMEQAEPDEARRRFDVLYSRVQTLKNAPAFAGALDGFLVRCLSWRPIGAADGMSRVCHPG